MIKRIVVCIGIVFAVSVSAHERASAQSAAELNSAARELIVAMRATDQIKAIIPTISKVLRPVIVQGRPEVDRDYDATFQQVADAFLRRLSDLVDAMIPVYVRHFTAPEMRALAEFMRGPIGQKFVEKNPVVMQEAMLVGQKFGERIAAELAEKMVEELRRRGHKI